MFKKTVLTFAMVLMATSAFAEIDTARDSKDATHSVDAKGAAVKDATSNRNAALEVKIKTLTSNEKEAQALRNSAEVTLTVDGKSVSGHDMIDQLVAIKSTLDPKKQKQFDTVVAFVSKMSHVKGESSKAKSAYMKEVSLSKAILQSYTPSEMQSHIDFQTAVLKAYHDTGKMDDALTSKLKEECGGNMSCVDQKSDEIANCIEG